ncbi:MAG: hypothetical protein KF796_06040 [Ramlibacter sp.]|nr:hypothetical protein [Ramlibacter sp.]
MKRILMSLLAVWACIAMVGCAHPITMNPDLAAVKAAGAGVTVIEKNVGYHIPDAARALEVTTPGGGGDKVRYFPYRDLEPGLYAALGEVFRGVTKIANPTDKAAMKSNGVSLLITPEINTSSFSESIVTWPPTLFTVKLICTIADGEGKTVQVLTVNGEGRASFDEFKSNFSLSAVRATNDALAKLVKALASSPELRK